MPKWLGFSVAAQPAEEISTRFQGNSANSVPFCPSYSQTKCSLFADHCLGCLSDPTAHLGAAAQEVRVHLAVLPNQNGDGD